MKYDKIGAYDKTKDDSINICLNCTKEKCNGKCNLNNVRDIKNKNNVGDK